MGCNSSNLAVVTEDEGRRRTRSNTNPSRPPRSILISTISDGPSSNTNTTTSTNNRTSHPPFQVSSIPSRRIMNDQHIATTLQLIANLDRPSLIALPIPTTTTTTTTTTTSRSIPRPRPEFFSVRRSTPDIMGNERVERLQLELETMERIFQSLLGNIQPILGGEQGEERGELENNESHPPASSQVISSLPIITISDTNTTTTNVCTTTTTTTCTQGECCVCFLEHKQNDQVKKLPCGHLFHSSCIDQWLEKRNTCPICRWELPTDNEQYEVGRVQRMKDRKICIQEHDLEQMTLQEMENLLIQIGDCDTTTTNNNNDLSQEDENGENGENDYHRDQLIARIQECPMVKIEFAASDKSLE